MSVHYPHEIRELLLKLNLFRGLDEAELTLLLAQAELVDVGTGDYPIREGDRGQHLFVLLAGSARISKRSFGIQKVIQDLKPGECFGEMSLIECRPRSASVKAMSACKLLKIDGEHIAQVPSTAAKLYRNIATLLSQRLRHANDILTLG
ncbi:MAG: cyclic nucleotide-binding domain-containing protein [Burkholderiaceae bacterium]|nr:cyclic nucleotide-binding domain-containing protein [Burkholderiaceae bacterium]